MAFAGAAAARFTGVFGETAADGAVLALDRLAAVGFVRRSAALDVATGFFAGRGGISGAFRALASDAAVGAKSPDAGVFGLLTEEGVFGRELVGVFARAGVTGGGRTDALDDGRELGAAALTFLMLDDVRSVWGCEAEVDEESDDGPW